MVSRARRHAGRAALLPARGPPHLHRNPLYLVLDEYLGNIYVCIAIMKNERKIKKGDGKGIGRGDCL